MTTTSELVDATFVVNAWGSVAGGVWPRFVLRLDGAEIGQTYVTSSTPERYSFTTKVAADQAHKLQIHYENDAFINGQDRNLFVRSVEVNGTIVPVTATGVTYDKGTVDGRDVVVGQEGLYWGGALDVPLAATLFPAPDAPPAPAPTTGGTMISNLTVTAWGDPAGGRPPHFVLRVDDRIIGEAWVDSRTPKDYAFKIDVDPNEAHKIQIHYDNDANVNGVDRNLFVGGITIDGKTIKSTSEYASYDKGAVDGKYVVAGQEGLYWGGALTFGVPEEYFGGAYVPPPPPPPPPPADTSGVQITVNASGSSAGGVPPHFKLLVDGKVVGDAWVNASQTAPYTFKVDVAPSQAHKIQIHYDNDTWINGQDRNLFVKSVVINGKTVAATDPIVTYDKGAVDGKDVVKGQEGLYWGGALTVDAPASYFGVVVPPPPAPKGPAFYVAANGKDTWSGKLAAPNADGTDGPFASLERARDAMRASDIDTTYVREGTYRLSKTLELTSLDNGVTFKNYPGETPVLSGGQKVTGFTHEGNGVYSVKLATPTEFDLTIGGVRQHLAEKGAWDAADPKAGWFFADAASGGPSANALRYHTGDVSATDFKPGTMIQVFDVERLTDGLVEVAGIDATTRTISFKSSAGFVLNEGATYRLLDNAAFVDKPGEFAWRTSDGKLVVKPVNPSTFEADGVEVARLGTLVRLTGTTGVTIEGLDFTNGRANGSALELISASGNKVGDNHFENVGTAILLKGANANLIGGNAIEHTARHGIELMNDSNRNKIYSNDIEHVGELRKHVAGIMASGADDNVISHNEISDSPRYGISIKNWASTNVNTGNIIEYNTVLRTGQETADMGGIEILGRSGGNTNMLVKGNWIEDVGGLATNGSDQWLVKHKGFGVYLDDLTGGVTVRDNFFKNTSTAAVHVHGGDNNLVENNFSILSKNSEEFIRIGWNPKFGDAGTPRNNTVVENVIHGTLPLDDYHELLSANNPTINRNLVWNVPTYGANDVAGNPLFENAYWGNYALKAGSPAFGMGIHDLAWSQFGNDQFTGTTDLPAFWDAY